LRQVKGNFLPPHGGALAVEVEQPCQRVVFGDIGGPARGCATAIFEFAMGVVEPSRPLAYVAEKMLILAPL